MDKLISKFKTKKKGNLLSDPSDSVSPRDTSTTPSSVANQPPLPNFSSLLGSPTNSNQSSSISPPNTIPAQGGSGHERRISSLQQQHPDYQYQPAPYSVVGGDGAIGGLDWNEDPFIEETNPTGDDSHQILVPTLGQIDQLTDAQEQSLRLTSSTFTESTTTDDDSFPIPTRSRSNAESLTLPPNYPQPAIHMPPTMTQIPERVDSTSSSASAVGGSPSRLGSFKMAAASSAAAMVAGSKSTSITANSSATSVLTVVTATTLPGSTSNPSSRRGSSAGLTVTSTDSPNLTAATGAPPNLLVISAVSNMSASPVTEPSSSPVTPPAPTPLNTNTAARSNNTAALNVQGVTSSAASSVAGAPSAGFLYQRLPPPPAVRPSVGGPHTAMMSIGRAVGEEVKSLVQSDRLTTSASTDSTAVPRVTSPGYLAYVTAIQQAKNKSQSPPPQPAKSPTKGSNPSTASTTTGRPAPIIVAPPTQPPSSTLANGGPGSTIAPPPPALPPRTHIRHRYSTTRYGSRRGSVTENESTQTENDKTALTTEQLIPLHPMAHLVMTTYLLLYFTLHLFLPGLIALALPLLVYYLILQFAYPIDTYLRRKYPHIMIALTSPRANDSQTATTVTDANPTSTGSSDPSPVVTPLEVMMDDTLEAAVSSFRRTRSGATSQGAAAVQRIRRKESNLDPPTEMNETTEVK